jgi:hypothetical protein
MIKYPSHGSKPAPLTLTLTFMPLSYSKSCNQDYFLLLNNEDNGYELTVTDFDSIWSVQMSWEELVRKHGSGYRGDFKARFLECVCDELHICHANLEVISKSSMNVRQSCCLLLTMADLNLPEHSLWSISS